MRDLNFNYYTGCTIYVNNDGVSEDETPRETKSTEPQHREPAEAPVPEPSPRDHLPLLLQSDAAYEFLTIGVSRGWLDKNFKPITTAAPKGFFAVFANAASRRLGLTQPYAPFIQHWGDKYKYLSQAANDLSDSSYQSFKDTVEDAFDNGMENPCRKSQP